MGDEQRSCPCRFLALSESAVRSYRDDFDGDEGCEVDRRGAHDEEGGCGFTEDVLVELVEEQSGVDFDVRIDEHGSVDDVGSGASEPGEFGGDVAAGGAELFVEGIGENRFAFVEVGDARRSRHDKIACGDGERRSERAAKWIVPFKLRQKASS
jgi:hypothetical protein